MAADTKATLAPRPPCSRERALINPVREPGEVLVTPRVVLAFTRPDYHKLCRLAQGTHPPRYLWDCAVHEGSWEGKTITVAGPVLGAPYAVMVTEKLIALGAEVVLALGWCGSLKEEIKVGSIIVPTTAVSGDGTSPHYLAAGAEPAPHPGLGNLLQARLAAAAIPCHYGPVWTTDGFYRETAEQVRYYQDRGVYGVDLEMAALFALGQYRQVAVAGLLVVSDELAGPTWQPGFKTPAFRRARDAAARVALSVTAATEA